MQIIVSSENNMVTRGIRDNIMHAYNTEGEQNKRKICFSLTLFFAEGGGKNTFRHFIGVISKNGPSDRRTQSYF